MEQKLRQQLEEILSRHLDWFSLELRSFISENNLKGNLVCQCSSNDSGFMLASASYFPNNDRAEEAIDFCITLSINSQTQNMNLLIDIYWSYGSQIQDLIDINNIDLDNAVLQIDSIIKKSKRELLSAMINQISIDRPPRYRKD